MKHQRQVEEAKNIVSNIVPPIITTVFSALNPNLGIVAAGIIGTWFALSDHNNKRLKELEETVGIAKIEKLLNKPQSIDIVTRILQNILTEPYLEKRKIFYNYLNNIGDDAESEFNYHTKVITVINQITLEELSILEFFNDNYVKVLAKTGRSGSGVNVNELKELTDFKKYSDPEIILDQLASYGLLILRTGLGNGNLYGPLKDFGVTFLRLIHTPE